MAIGNGRDRAPPANLLGYSVDWGAGRADADGRGTSGDQGELATAITARRGTSTAMTTMTRSASPVTTSQPSRFGVVELTTLWLVLLFGIPATQVIGPLGGIGTPAMLIALVGAGWWASTRVVPSIPADRDVQPVRIYLYLFLGYMLLSFAIGHTRPLTALEQTGSIRAVITWGALSGLALLVMDGTDDLASLRTVLRRLVWCGVFLAVLGLLQWVTGSLLIPRVPGLALNHDVVGVGARSIFNRPRGTALHAIEFSVVLAALLPIALHCALETPASERQRRRLGIGAAIIALGVPISISRSGIVVLFVSLAIMLASWGWRRRANAAIIGVAAVPLLWLTVPGLVGTLRGLFRGTEHDPSIQARIERIPRVMELIREYPWLGRGVGTYSVDDYFLVDNEIFVSTIELGVVGVTLTLGLFVFAVIAARTSRHHPNATRETNHLATALAASIAGIVVSLATFDAFHYRILTGVLFLLIGTAGAVWRLTRRPPS